RTYLAISNERPKPFVWTKSADEILATVARSCRRTSDSGH
ncbi:MAG: IS630 family transposase, partial [Chloroflexota bacterium]